MAGNQFSFCFWAWDYCPEKYRLKCHLEKAEIWLNQPSSRPWQNSRLEVWFENSIRQRITRRLRVRWCALVFFIGFDARAGVLFGPAVIAAWFSANGKFVKSQPRSGLLGVEPSLFAAVEKWAWFVLCGILLIRLSFLLGAVETRQQSVKAAFASNRKLPFKKLAQQPAIPQVAFESAGKRGFSQAGLFAGKFLGGRKQGRLGAHRQTAQARETFFQRELDEPIEGVFVK